MVILSISRSQECPEGYEDGTDREVFEETGLLLPFLKEIMVYDFHWRGITHKIYMYLSQIDVITPHVRLDLQDHVENIDYKWVKLDGLEEYMGQATTNLRKMYDELSVKDEIFEQNEAYQLKMKRNHRNKKKKLLGLGKNKHFGGGKGHKERIIAVLSLLHRDLELSERKNSQKNTKNKEKMMNLDDILPLLSHEAEEFALKVEAFCKDTDGNFLQPVRLNHKEDRFYWCILQKKIYFDQWKL